MKSPSSKIGIISGFGPLAGADVASKIFQYAAEHYGAVEDYEYPNLALISQGVAGFDNQGAITADFKPGILEIVEQLNKVEASVIGIACNTAHLFYEPLNSVSNAPIINLIEEVVAAVDAHKSGRPLLLSSSTTKNTKLYTDKLDSCHIAYVAPSGKIQKLVDQAIHLVMAHKLVKAGQKIDEIIHQVGTENFDFIVAACTELPIAIAYSKIKTDYQIIDSNQILAQALTDYYYRSLRSTPSPVNLLH
jgi:aspartate racemase